MVSLTLNKDIIMGGVAPFNRGGEYLTFLFNQEGEEHLVPKSLFEKSHTIQADFNNHITVNHIASSTFFSLTTYLSGNHQELTPQKVSEMIEAAKSLGLFETVKELSAFFTHEA